jgi:hypothetical protein
MNCRTANVLWHPRYYTLRNYKWRQNRFSENCQSSRNYSELTDKNIVVFSTEDSSADGLGDEYLAASGLVTQP